MGLYYHDPLSLSTELADTYSVASSSGLEDTELFAAGAFFELIITAPFWGHDFRPFFSRFQPVRNISLSFSNAFHALSTVKT